MEKMHKKNKHMTLEDRIEIQECLGKRMTFKEIAERIGKDQTTVSKEVKLHMTPQTNSYSVDGKYCPKLLKAPFVCNGCEMRRYGSCKFTHQMYNAKTAQEAYETLLVEAREGTPLNKEIFYETERIVSDSVRRGQHIYHIIKTHDLPVSKSTVYRYINKGYYDISRIELPRAVKFKPRRKKHQDYVPKAVKSERTYEDFQAYISNNNITGYTEMDTVIGLIGGKVILTLHFTAFNFMTAILLDNKTAAEAASKIIDFKKRLADSGFSFGALFPVILTDNGGEFSQVGAFENDISGNRESRVFFCDPLSPYEKARIEKNHTLFRDIVPKGTPFESFTQDKLNMIFSHVNSVKREAFNAKTPYELFTFAYSEDAAHALGIYEISPEKVCQSPALLK